MPIGILGDTIRPKDTCPIRPQTLPENTKTTTTPDRAMDNDPGSPTTARALDDYLLARSTLARLVADTPRVPERDPDDHTDEDRAVLRARLKNMAADALAHLDAMHQDAARCMQVLAKTVQQLEKDDRTLHFALPLVDESLGLLDTSRARLGQALRTMATAEAHIHCPGEFAVGL